MFAAVQIPLGDLRHFVAEQTGRLVAPPWPLVDESKHFVRSVGPIRRRRRGGDPDLAGESRYCDARRAMVFRADSGDLAHRGAPGTHLTPRYRRFVATGRMDWPGAVARMDFGFNVRSRKSTGRVTGRSLPKPEDAALAAVTVMLSIPPHRTQPRSLLNAGDAIAEKIRHATTSLTDPPSRICPWWVQSGRPLVLIEAPFDMRSVATLNPPIGGDTDLSNQLAYRLYFSSIEYRKRTVPLWALFYRKDISSESLRKLRMHLWRLHNEREVLRIVLAKCVERQLDPKQPALRDYLERQSKSLRRAIRDELPQAEFLSHAYAQDALVNASEIGELHQILRDVNRGVAASVLPVAAGVPHVPGNARYHTADGELQMVIDPDDGDNLLAREMTSQTGTDRMIKMRREGPYVQADVIDSLRVRTNEGQFDYSKLLDLIDELNQNYASANVYTTHMIIRAILDHVPPLLGYKTFTEVANNYKDWGQTNKGYMGELLAFKKQADDALHRRISPESDLLKFRHLPLDLYINVLLRECARARLTKS